MFVDQRNDVFHVVLLKNPGVTMLMIDFLCVIFAQYASNQFRIAFDFVIDDDLFQRHDDV